MNNPKPKRNGPSNWRTPPALFAALDAEFRFTIDVAAEPDNALCFAYLTGPHLEGAPYFTDACGCGLCAPWNTTICPPGAAFCNPPYRDIPPWVEACELEEDMTRVLLIPGDHSAGWYQRACETAWEERRYRRRVPFIDPATGKPVTGNFRPSTAFVWRPGPRPYLAPAVSFVDYPS